MAAPNYAAYDGPNDDELSLSEAAHLWVEMVPPPERDGQPFPGLPGTGWKRDFWRWLKRHIRRRLKLQYVPKGHQQFPRSLYLEIATSEECAGLVKTFPQLKARPLFLFPEDRAVSKNRSTAKGRDDALQEFRCLRQGPKLKTTKGYIKEAADKFKITQTQAHDAFYKAAKTVGNPDWSKRGPKEK